MQRKLRLLIPVLILAAAMVFCGFTGQKKPSIRDQLLAQKEEQDVQNVQHEVVVYFAGWHLNQENARFGGEVADIPWDSVSYVNHAFWAVEPADGTEESSFQRRASGLGARTQFRIVPMDSANDLENDAPSRKMPGIAQNHFAQYAHFSQLYPQVNILISIGGWTRSGYFSEMAFTPEGRASFIASCLELMQQYPWIDGFDIDWEHPAGSRDGERRADVNDPADQGCPIFGEASQDRENFASLMAELKAAMAEVYGEGVKKLTACSSGSTGWTLPCQDWAAAAPSLDLINIMSYDLAGIWDGITGHSSSASLGKGGAMHMKMQGIPVSKVCMGSPLYGTSFRMKEITKMPVGTPVEPVKPIGNEICTQDQILAWEAEAVSGYTIEYTDGKYIMGQTFDHGGSGWHMCYDARNGAPYLFNDDESSEYYRIFLSYENPLSLQDKLDYIREKGIGGIIVWETAQDTADYRMIRHMGQSLLSEN